jgi:hypothetical protein
MAPKAAHEAAKKKTAKQKKILMVLALPMLGALVYAYMTLTSLGGHPQPPATPPAAATPASGSASTAGGVPIAAVSPGIVAPQVGYLHSFTALGMKDPFYDHGPKPGEAPASSSSKSTPKKENKSTGNGNGSQSKQPSVPLTGAVISINGKKLALAIGSEFGQAPGLSGVSLFRLAKVTKTTALIDVVGTKQTFTLHVKKPLTLQQSGGWTYTLILEPLGTAAPMTVQPTINDATP